MYRSIVLPIIIWKSDTGRTVIFGKFKGVLNFETTDKVCIYTPCDSNGIVNNMKLYLFLNSWKYHLTVFTNSIIVMERWLESISVSDRMCLSGLKVKTRIFRVPCSTGCNCRRRAIQLHFDNSHNFGTLGLRFYGW